MPDKKTTTRDEVGVTAAEAAVADEISALMSPPKGQEGERDEPVQLFESKDTGHENTVNDFGDVREESYEQERSAEAKEDAPEPEGRKEESKSVEKAESRSEEDEQVEDELSEVEQLRIQNERFMQLLDNGIKLPPLAHEPSTEMADQAKPDEIPLPSVPSFQGIDGSSIVGGVTDEELYDAQGDVAAQRLLLEKVAGAAAAAAVQTSRLGTREEIESFNRADRVINDFKSLEHNSDISHVMQTVIERGIEIQERNIDISPTDALDMAGDQVREHLEMRVPEKTTKQGKGEQQTVKRIRGAKNGVTPVQPRHANKTGRRRMPKVDPNEGLSDFDKEANEIIAAGQRGNFGAR